MPFLMERTQAKRLTEGEMRAMFDEIDTNRWEGGVQRMSAKAGVVRGTSTAQACRTCRDAVILPAMVQNQQQRLQCFFLG